MDSRRLLILLCCLAPALPYAQPPKLVLQPDQMVIFDPRINIELNCVAQAEPAPKYTWYKNGLIFDPSGNDFRIAQRADSGSLTITNPRDSDAGLFQCNATNRFGTAISVIADVRKSVLESFPPVTEPRRVLAKIGQPAKLQCIPPKGLPNPMVFWGIRDRTSGAFRTITYSDRITQDLDGNLYFANVIQEDYQNGDIYVCSAFSPMLNIMTQGENQVLMPESGAVGQTRPKIVWGSQMNRVALRGRDMRLKCIFSGNPTPRVYWSKIGGELPVNRYEYNSEGQELTIHDVQFSDEAIYQCLGQNAQGDAKHAVHIKVESAPYWKDEPTDQSASEGDSVTVLCDAEGRPSPKIEWFYNGIPIQNAPKMNNRFVTGNNLTLINLIKDVDTAVYQCNASNPVGYVFKNVYVNVLAVKPEFLKKPEKNLRIVEGQNVTISCKVFAAPRARITWTRGSSRQALTGGRYRIREDGDLVITDASASDSGDYECAAENRLGSIAEKGSVQIKMRTRITTPPETQEMRAGMRVYFRCLAIADSALHLEIVWRKNGQELVYGGRLFKDINNRNTLVIDNVQHDDGGTYECVARTELDEVAEKATLTVKDVPDAPKLVSVDCRKGDPITGQEPQATLQWAPEGDNGAQILSYTIQYNTSFTPNVWEDVYFTTTMERQFAVGGSGLSGSGGTLQRETYDVRTKVIPFTTRTFAFNLSCWANYTLRVIARNQIGDSPPSELLLDTFQANGQQVTSDRLKVCTTNECRPHRHPSNVRGAGTKPGNLVIRWTAMPKVEWNAPTFKYRVQYRLAQNQSLGATSAVLNNRGKRQTPQQLNKDWTVVEKKATEDYHEVTNLPIYTLYEFQVIGFNELPNNLGGDARAPIDTNRGFSGEDRPRSAPANFRVERVFDATTAEFAWDAIPVAREREVMQGALRGYKIQYWAAEEGESRMREVQLIGRHARANVTRLPAYSTVVAQLVSMNGQYMSTPSSRATFKTPEGRPGPVRSLQAFPAGANAILLKWEPPEEPNGILIGFEVTYREVKSIREPLGPTRQPIRLDIADMRTYTLSGLQPETKYLVYVRARTARGSSLEDAYVEQQTSTGLKPSKPGFSVVRVTENSLNVTWNPDEMLQRASIFYLHYRLKDTTQWLKTKFAITENWIDVPHLVSGSTYEIQLVATNGIGDETISDVQTIHTQGMGRSVGSVATSRWFIGMMVAIAVLLIILIVVCLVRRNRGGRYSVQEKEGIARAHDADSGEHHQEIGFHEYRGSSPSLKKSQGSLYDPVPDDEKHSETDSMAEYGDQETGKFNEDGSFIGQYRGRQAPPRPPSHQFISADESGPHSTFV